MKTSKLVTLLTLAAMSAGAQVPRDFVADVSRPATWQASAYRGETLAIAARLVDGRRRPFPVPAGASAQIFWATNNADWFAPRPASVTTDGVIRATWTPDMDCGAAAYRIFLAVAEDGTNICYGANMLLRMLGSPGASPSAAPFPVEFEAEAWAWATPGDVSNIVTKAYVESLGIEAGLTDESDPVWESEKSRYATSSALADVARDASLIYQMMVGSNVVAEVTNYNSRARAPQLRLLQLDGTNGYVTVWTETDGLSRTLGEANAHADAATNALARAKADRAWSRHTSALGADAPPDTTWISTPATVISGGYEYAKVITSAGEAWVLCSNGLVAGGDTNAYFQIRTLDGEPLFGIEKTDDQMISVSAASISVTGNTVTIPLDVISARPPACYATDSLTNPSWTDLSDSANWPEWVSAASCTGSAGEWTWTITSTAPSAFFMFRVLQEGSTVIRHFAPTDLSRGVWFNGQKYIPAASGNNLIWTKAQ